MRFLICLFAWLQMGLTVIEGNSRLITDLLSSYDIRQRPIEDASQPVTIEIEAGLRNIISVDAKTQIMKSSLWMKQYWNDTRLSWNPDEYNGTTEIYLDHKYHWKPDIVLFNNAQDEMKQVFHDVITHISSAGEVMYLFPAVYTTTCTLDVYYFPFDQHPCNFHFGSWAQDGDSLILLKHGNESAESAFYEKNSEWILVEYYVEESMIKYHCCPAPFYHVTFRLTLRRRWLINLFYIFLPLGVTNAMATVQFLLPVDSGEKVTLLHYISTTLILVGLSMISTVLVLHLHYNGSHDNHMQMPLWMRKYLLHWLSRCLCMHRFVTTDEEHELKTSLYRSSMELIQEAEEDEDEADQEVEVKPEPLPKVHSRFRRHSMVHPQNGKSLTNTASNLSASGVLRLRPSELHQHRDVMIYKLLNHAETYQERETDKERDGEYRCEWQQLAMLTDRVFFIIFLTTAIILHLYVFLNHPAYSSDVIG